MGMGVSGKGWDPKPMNTFQSIINVIICQKSSLVLIFQSTFWKEGVGAKQKFILCACENDDKTFETTWKSIPLKYFENKNLSKLDQQT